MSNLLRLVKLPRPPRLHPRGVTFEASSPTDPPSNRVIRLPGGPPSRVVSKGFQFCRGITAKP